MQFEVATLAQLGLKFVFANVVEAMSTQNFGWSYGRKWCAAALWWFDIELIFFALTTMFFMFFHFCYAAPGSCMNPWKVKLVEADQLMKMLGSWLVFPCEPKWKNTNQFRVWCFCENPCAWFFRLATAWYSAATQSEAPRCHPHGSDLLRVNI